jgi:hypothetical protein
LALASDAVQILGGVVPNVFKSVIRLRDRSKVRKETSGADLEINGANSGGVREEDEEEDHHQSDLPGKDADTLCYIAKFILVSLYMAPAPTTAHHLFWDFCSISQLLVVVGGHRR